MAMPAPRVLIVDDNVPSAKTLKLVLVAEGFEADCAGTADEAMQTATEGVYEAALIDITLPDRSGLDLLPELKTVFPDLVAIMVTGHASAQNSIEALNRGASGYVQKPVEVQHLLQMLRNGLEKKRLEEENWRMLRRLSLLHAVGATVSVGLEAESTLSETLTLVVSLLDIPGGGLWWSLPSEEGPRLVASVAMPDDVAACVVERIASLPRDISEIDELNRQPWVEHNIQCEGTGGGWRLRLVPLRGHDKTLGWMAIGGQGWDDAQAEEAEVIVAVAGQVGVAMENMRLYADLSDAHEQVKEAQDQLVQSEKLSAVGRVVSGVAHELNNPLMAVIGYSELLAEGTLGEQAPELARRVHSQARRCADIVQGLLSFARREPITFSSADVNDIILSAIEAADHQRSEDTEVVRDLDSSVPVIAGDPGALQQVLVNILYNAFQVINGNGGSVSVSSRLRNDGISVEIKDSGPGISGDVLPRVFDPFFTTKGVGKGTGLGLSLSHGIIQEHGGELRASNAPEGGAVFSIGLPVAAPPERDVGAAIVQDAPWLQ